MKITRLWSLFKSRAEATDQDQHLLNTFCLQRVLTWALHPLIIVYLSCSLVIALSREVLPEKRERERRFKLFAPGRLLKIADCMNSFGFFVVRVEPFEIGEGWADLAAVWLTLSRC